MLEKRSLQKELLDAPGIPVADLERNLYELHIINKWLGGYRISLNAIKKIILPGMVIADIGCGGGDTLKEIGRNIPGVTLVGIDLLPACIDYSAKNDPIPGTRFIVDDYRNIYLHETRVDVLHASLFCHHLSDDEIIELIRLARRNGSILVINDLERNIFAWWFIRFLTSLFSKSRLVKNDAPLSVARGFRKKEWKELLRRAGAQKFSIKNKWAFRHEVIIYE
jgi:SAM-dependent methyltransferase